MDFVDAKNIHVLNVLSLGFGGCWRFLTGVQHLDLDLDMVSNLAWIFPKVLSHSDQWKLRYSQSRISTVLSQLREVVPGWGGVGGSEF